MLCLVRHGPCFGARLASARCRRSVRQVLLLGTACCAMLCSYDFATARQARCRWGLGRPCARTHTSKDVEIYGEVRFGGPGVLCLSRPCLSGTMTGHGAGCVADLCSSMSVQIAQVIGLGRWRRRGRIVAHIRCPVACQCGFLIAAFAGELTDGTWKARSYWMRMETRKPEFILGTLKLCSAEKLCSAGMLCAVSNRRVCMQGCRADRILAWPFLARVTTVLACSRECRTWLAFRPPFLPVATR